VLKLLVDTKREGILLTRVLFDKGVNIIVLFGTVQLPTVELRPNRGSLLVDMYCGQIDVAVASPSTVTGNMVEDTMVGMKVRFLQIVIVSIVVTVVHSSSIIVV
jgi:hypothetical protein